jgi:hypothetical protein
VCISDNFGLKIPSARSRVILEKLIVAQLLKLFPVSYRNRRFVILFTKSLSQINPAHSLPRTLFLSDPFHYYSPIYIYVPSWTFLSECHTKFSSLTFKDSVAVVTSSDSVCATHRISEISVRLCQVSQQYCSLISGIHKPVRSSTVRKINYSLTYPCSWS